ncbi:UNVERIFIED_CONTAM: putative LRR receptor-like protein kinase [Sesamum radiatum]|uniref:LRR receptor-like protein kinase n=1 Tax=Sesamum radiatum TaxID=300843 RepID=A0AAW2REW3_SESRA
MQKVRVESNRENDGSSIEPKLRQLTFAEVTNLIAEKRILGEGGFGTVYHCSMNGAEVAVKVLKVFPAQETKDFQAEVKILATVYHRNLTRILGYCNEGVNKAIMFELIEKGNLKHNLSERNSNVLSWELRLSILLGTAEGLGYLHHGCNPPIIHRDIKPENILLTREFEAKLADFGLSRIFHFESAGASSRIVGTPGYLDPEYIHPRLLTEKVDVYSFGVVMLVVITGRTTVVEGATHITQWVSEKVTNGDIRGIVDPRLERSYNVNVAWRVVELAMACVSSNSSSRPNMSYVVRELKECVPQPVIRSSNDAAGIALTTSNIRSVFRPHTRLLGFEVCKRVGYFSSNPPRRVRYDRSLHKVFEQDPTWGDHDDGVFVIQSRHELVDKMCS